jgi:hypothetical protein
MADVSQLGPQAPQVTPPRAVAGGTARASQAVDQHSPPPGLAQLPVGLPTSCHLPQDAALVLSNVNSDLSDTLAPLRLSLSAIQLMHITVTEPMHVNFCALFAVGQGTRAVVALVWDTVAASGAPGIRFHEWWSAVRLAKDRAGWARKLNVLEAPLAPAILIASDWSRVGFLVAASLSDSWSEALSLEQLNPAMGDLATLVNHANDNPSTDHTAETLWINIAPTQ